MRLLIITNNSSRASFKQRIGVYLDALRSGGIVCEVAELPSGLMACRRLFQYSSNFDAVFLHKKALNVLAAFWLRKYSKNIIYNFDDAIMYSDKAPERNNWSRLSRFRRSVKLADMVIVGSSYLAEHAAKFNSNVKVLPIGLDYGNYVFADHSEINNKIRLVWIGSKSTLGYLADIKPALEEIGARYDNVILQIISDDFFDMQNMPVEKCLWSEETRYNDLAAGTIGLAPLPDNRFTQGKCSFKVLEYSSSSLPVVASPVGTNSNYVMDGITGFHASQNQEWVDRLSKLIEDREMVKKMGEAGRALAKKYDVVNIGKKLNDLILECAGKEK
jgi:glycosyltransferase involved in cell wall biosynthesis